MANDKDKKNIRNKSIADKIISESHQRASQEGLTGSFQFEFCYRSGHLEYLKETRTRGFKLGEESQ